MSPADRTSLDAALALLASLVRLAWHPLRRRWHVAWTLAGRIAAAGGVYLPVVDLVSVTRPQQWIALGEEERFDDWCITVTSAGGDAEGYHVLASIAKP